MRLCRKEINENKKKDIAKISFIFASDFFWHKKLYYYIKENMKNNILFDSAFFHIYWYSYW